SDSDTLFGFIVRAYGIHGCQPASQTCDGLEGGPDWLTKDRFEIKAKVSDNEPDYTMVQFLQGETPRLGLMMRALLADRFGLKVHTELRTMPVFAMTIAKGGSKLKTKGEAETTKMLDGVPPPNHSVMFTVVPGTQPITRMMVQDRSLQQVADTLTMFLGRPVVDQTGLRGNFDFTLDYDRNPDEAPPGKQLADPSMFPAFQQQLGIKIEATKAPVEVLVIDSVQRPTDN
ncbi:MAG: TIGR03435 family protein, partial [Acidobacteriota bacterium]